MTATHMASTSDTSRFDNATIGEDALIDPDVEVGYRYHADCGPATIGKHCALRKGTVIYGDVKKIPHLRLLGWLLWAYSRCGVSTGVLIGLCAASLRGLATVSRQLWSLSG